MTCGRHSRIDLVPIAALLWLLLGSTPAAAIRIQAESFSASHNIAPDPFTVTGGVLYGLDFEGEWVRYDLPPLLPGAYAVGLQCWGVTGYPFHLQIVLESPPASTQTVDLQFTGRGTCGG